MKNILKYIVALFVASSLFSSCEEFENYEKVMDASKPYVYMAPTPNNVYRAFVTHTPIGSVSTFTAKFPVQCNTANHSKTVVSLSVDNSLIEVYNAQHNTNYKAVDAALVKLETNSNLTIPSGKLLSSDSVSISFTGDLSAIDNKEGFLIPLKLNHVSGERISEDYNVVNIVVNSQHNNFVLKPMETNIIGTLITDRTTWKAFNGSDGSSIEGTALFDGNKSTNVKATSVIFDLGDEKQVGAFRVFVRNADYGEDYRANKIKVSLSSNNVSYESVGEADADHMMLTAANEQICVLYREMNARYVKIELTCKYFYGCAEFDVYAK